MDLGLDIAPLQNASVLRVRKGDRMSIGSLTGNISLLIIGDRLATLEQYAPTVAGASIVVIMAAVKNDNARPGFVCIDAMVRHDIYSFC